MCGHGVGVLEGEWKDLFPDDAGTASADTDQSDDGDSMQGVGKGET